jgi:glycine betaine/proline transport system permease protein
VWGEEVQDREGRGRSLGRARFRRGEQRVLSVRGGGAVASSPSGLVTRRRGPVAHDFGVVMERLIGALVRRVDRLLDLANGALERLVDVLEALLTVPPSFVVALLLGLLAWRGHRLAAGILVVIGVHVISYVGLWPETVLTLSTGLVAAVVGAALVVGVRLVVGFLRRVTPPRLRRLDHHNPLVAREALSMAALLGVCVAGVALVPILSGSRTPAWIAASALVAGVVLVRMRSSPEVSDRSSVPAEVIGGAVLAGCAAALVVGLVSGDGLGGLARRAAAQADASGGVPVALAIVALMTVVSITAGGRRPDPGHTPSVEPVGAAVEEQRR